MSNYLNFAIQDREALKQYIMRNLGVATLVGYSPKKKLEAGTSTTHGKTTVSRNHG